MGIPDDSQAAGKRLDLSCKPKGLQLERFINLLENCIHITKRYSDEAEAFDVIFGEETASLLGFSKGYVAAVDITEGTVKIIYYINQKRWDADGDKEMMEHFAGIQRPAITEQGKLVKFMQQYKDSYITPDFTRDDKFSEDLRKSLIFKTVIVSPFVVLNEVIGLTLLGYTDYPSLEIQWMHEYLLTYSVLPVIQSFWFRNFKEQLERVLQWKQLGENTTALAHGLKTPIAGLDLFFGLLDSQGGDLLRDESMIRNAEKQLDTIRSITTNLLSYVRKVEIDRHPILVRELLQEAIDSSLPEAKNTPVTGDALDKIINVDRDKISEVLRNLINNAYESAGLERSNKTHKVEIRATEANRELSISVLDNGTGVPKESMEEIFTPSYTTKDEGHGLGLAIAQRFVNAHGGRMLVRNRKDGGACFEVILPW
jgi:signal transduction histidine kinase